MKCLFLAAGYATRLYPLTENFPKPLLPIKGVPLLDYFINDLEEIGCIDEYIVVSNHKFAHFFEKWSKTHSQKITIVDDGTTTNENRLGAVKDIQLVINNLGINEDLLVLAGDNLLDFSLKEFIIFFKEKNNSCVMRYFESNLNKIKKSANLIIDENDKIIKMLEKPETPESNWCCPPFYLYKKEDLKLIDKCINETTYFDSPGAFASFAAKNSTLYAFLMNGKRIDVGTLEDYLNLK